MILVLVLLFGVSGVMTFNEIIYAYDTRRELDRFKSVVMSVFIVLSIALLLHVTGWVDLRSLDHR